MPAGGLNEAHLPPTSPRMRKGFSLFMPYLLLNMGPHITLLLTKACFRTARTGASTLATASASSTTAAPA